MDEIKAVRVRRNDINTGTLDIRVSIFKKDHTFGADERVVVGVYNPLKADAKVVWVETKYKKTASYKDYTDDQFLKDFIDMNSKIEGKQYYIIQDPFEFKVPIYRNFGSDPYYLNNGAIIYILWKDSGKDVGSQKYSDDSGHELTPHDITFKKTVKITSVNETKGFTLVKSTGLGKNSSFEYDGKPEEFAAYNSDKGIIAVALSSWKLTVPDYDDLALCSPDNESCSIIPYKSPLKPIVPEVPVTPVVEPKPVSAENNNKEKIKIVVQDQIIKVKEDVKSLKVHIGIVKNTPDPKVEPLLEQKTLNTEEDDFIDGEGIDYSDYVESDFTGDEEKWNPIPGLPDDIYDPDTEKGDPGPGVVDTPAPPSFVPASQTQKEFIKNAVQATLSKGSGKGLCGRFTFNHANNYIRLMQGKAVEQGTPHSAGGNARDSGYHKNLQSLGYKKTDYGSISRSSLINKIKTSGWSVGDVIAYWCTDGPSNQSHVMYGHTQIFTNGHHTNTKYRWSTDVINNFGEKGGGEFIYNSKSGDTWNLIYLQAPKTKRLNDAV